MWCILRFPIHGEHVIYDIDANRDACLSLLHIHSIILFRSQIDLDFYHGRVDTFRLFFGTQICGVVAPNRWGKGFNPGWGLSWEGMIRRDIMYAQGSILLSSLYHDMHEAVYREGKSIRVGVTLLHIWAYENIAVLRPIIVLVDIHEDEPVVYRYKVLMTL